MCSFVEIDLKEMTDEFEGKICFIFVKGIGGNGEVNLGVKFMKVCERVNLCDKLFFSIN